MQRLLPIFIIVLDSIFVKLSEIIFSPFLFLQNHNTALLFTFIYSSELCISYNIASLHLPIPAVLYDEGMDCFCSYGSDNLGCELVFWLAVERP